MPIGVRLHYTGDFLKAQVCKIINAFQDHQNECLMTLEKVVNV